MLERAKSDEGVRHVLSAFLDAPHSGVGKPQLAPHSPDETSSCASVLSESLSMQQSASGPRRGREDSPVSGGPGAAVPSQSSWLLRGSSSSRRATPAEPSK
jgi:hypothetical protein